MSEPNQNQPYRLHPEVADDLRGISAYIGHDSIDGANRVIQAISTTIESLVPLEVRHRGHHRTDLTNRPLLFISVYEYLVAYAPDEDPLLIIAVLHGRRNTRLLASLLEARH